MLPIAFVAEYKYCQRAAFYFLTGSENGEEENIYVQAGRSVHAKIDIKGKRYRSGFEEYKNIHLKSFDYGLVGKSDLVRIYSGEAIPIEYKSGFKKKSEYHKFQLLLQSLCIKEQMGLQVGRAAVYFYQVNKLVEYDLASEDFENAVQTITELRRDLSRHSIKNFKQINLPNCRNCSFYDICMPNLIDQRK